MLWYIAKRIFFFIPTLFLITLLTFVISVNAPGDPFGCEQEPERSVDIAAYLEACREERKQYGLDKPLFYLGFGALAQPDTFYRIVPEEQQYALSRILDQFGNWEAVQAYYRANQVLFRSIGQVNSGNGSDLIQLKRNVYKLFTAYQVDAIRGLYTAIGATIKHRPGLKVLEQPFQASVAAYLKLPETATPWKNYIPDIRLYGLDNQYHRWLIGICSGDLGISYQDKRPVAHVISDAIGWTLMISGISILLVFAFAVPLGVWAAKYRYRLPDRMISISLFGLYSLPNFWVATLLILFFGGGDFLDWFPAYGVGDPDKYTSWTDRLAERASHLVLPLICWIYPGLAFLSRLVRGSMVEALNQDFTRTARAKGLAEKSVLWKHSFRNALLPLITIVAYVFPLAISGSIVLEFIFSIPGMGKLTFDAVFTRNYPVVIAIVLLSSVLTLVGYLVADILYAWADPRITFLKKQHS